MKKIYSSPMIIESMSVETEKFLSGSPNYGVTGGSTDGDPDVSFVVGDDSDDEELDALGRQRGGDFGSLW